MKGQSSILGQLGVDQQVSDTKNKQENRSCTGLGTKEEYCYERSISVLLVLTCCLHCVIFCRVRLSSDN